MQLVPLTHIPEVVFTEARVPCPPERIAEVRARTTKAYAVARDDGTALAVFGFMAGNLLEPVRVMWASWLCTSRPKLSEFREGREQVEELLAGEDDQLLAEVAVDDSMANRFVEWLGFNLLVEAEQFNIYGRG